MNLIEFCGHDESHPVYSRVAVLNLNRQYDFLQTIIWAAINSEQRYLSHDIVKAVHFHAVTCLHSYAGQYRPCEVTVGQGEGKFVPPESYRVQSLMDDMVNTVNAGLGVQPPAVLAAYVLWRLNHVHPFTNGNGRTSRVLCHFVLCIAAGGFLPGSKPFPELIRENRAEYVAALKEVDATGNLQVLVDLVERLVNEQLASATEPSESGKQADL
jgi:Fic family protein